MKELQRRPSGVPESTHRETVQVHKVATPNTEKKACNRCGKQGHLGSQCVYKTAKCHECGKIGHLRQVCRSKPKRTAKLKPAQQQRTQNVREIDTDEETDVDTSKLLTVNASRGSVPPIQVDAYREINNHPLRMEVDTGAAYSLISESTYNELWPTRALTRSDIRLCTYSGEAMQVLGCCQVNVHYQSQASQKSLLIVGGAGPNLMGRNWLKNIRLDWSQINHVESSALKSLLYKHEAVFQGGLGELKGYQARILVNADAKPHFCKAQSVPYAYRELVEKELDCLVAEKILEPVQYAEWASPIVPVLKADKTI